MSLLASLVDAALDLGLDGLLDGGPALTERLGVEIQQALEVEFRQESASVTFCGVSGISIA